MITPGTFWLPTATRKLAGTETRPFLSILFSCVPKNIDISVRLHPFVRQPAHDPRPWLPLGNDGPSWGKLRSEEHTSELQSLMRISYAVFCLKNKNNNYHQQRKTQQRKQKKS